MDEKEIILTFLWANHDYSFDYSTEKPESPVGSIGFQLGMSNRTAEGYQAKINYSMLNIRVSGSGGNEIWIEYDTEEDDEYNEAELDFESELDIDVNMRVHGAEAEFSIPLLMEGERRIVDILRHFTLNIGAGYFWGSGDIEVSYYEYARLTGEDGDGEPFDEEEEESEEASLAFELDGSPGIKFGGGFNYEVADNILAFGDVNYRLLEMDIKLFDEKIFDDDSSEDLGGLEFKVGLGYSF